MPAQQFLRAAHASCFFPPVRIIYPGRLLAVGVFFCPAPRMSNLFLSWTSWELSVLESLLVGVCIGEQCFVPLLIIGVFGLFGILSMSLSISDRSRAGFKIMFPRLFIAPACSRVRYRRPIFCPSVRPSVRPSVCQHLCRRSTFMSKLVF